MFLIKHAQAAGNLLEDTAVSQEKPTLTLNMNTIPLLPKLTSR